MQVKRSSRSGNYLTWRMHVEDAYRAAGMVSEADRWQTCSDPALFFTPQTGESLPAESMGVVACTTDPAHFTKNICPTCDFRTCPDCAHRHSARLLARYMPILRECVNNPKPDWTLKKIELTTSLPLTETLIAAEINALYPLVRRCFENLLKDAYKRPVDISECGFIIAHEFGSNGLKLHFHILYYGPWLYHSALSKAWKQLTGWHGVFIKDIGHGKVYEDAEAAAAEVLKYTTKFWTRDRDGNVKYIPPNLIPVLHQTLQGRRRVRSWGLFYNVAEANEKASCPTCKSALCILSKTEYDIYVQTGWMPEQFTLALSSAALINLKLADKSAGPDPPDLVTKGRDAYDLRPDVLSLRLTRKIEGHNPEKPKARRPAKTPHGELLL